jgi:hypothetical protein
MNIKYSLKEIHPKIFLVGIENSYDLAMTFCRIQEFYESPYKEIKGKYFNMAEFQRIYSMRRGEGCFTYPIDWAGFNVPSNAIFNCYCSEHRPIIDFNNYDEVFWDIIRQISPVGGGLKKYYLIGSDPKSETTIEHEIAHAFYYLYPSYKKAANKITNQLPEKLYNKFKKHLLGIGYSDKVIKDEIQAYLSADPENLTDINETSKKDNKIINKLSKQLKNLNNEYRTRKS